MGIAKWCFVFFMPPASRRHEKIEVVYICKLEAGLIFFSTTTGTTSYIGTYFFLSLTMVIVINVTSVSVQVPYGLYIMPS